MPRCLLTIFLLLTWTGMAPALSTEMEVTPENISKCRHRFELTRGDHEDGTLEFTLKVSPMRGRLSPGRFCTLLIYAEPVDLRPDIITTKSANGLIGVQESPKKQPLLASCDIFETVRGDSLLYTATVDRSLLKQATFRFVEVGSFAFDAYSFVLEKFAGSAR